MNSAGSLDKGGVWEREVNRRLSLWITGGEKKDVFVRNVRSGGAYTAAQKAGREPMGFPGDAMAASPEAFSFLQRWHLEYKHWKDLGLTQALLTSSGDLFGVVEETEKQAKSSGRFFLIVAKQNRRPPLCLVPSECGVEHRLRFGGTMYHLLWNRRVIALRFDSFLLTPPHIWMS